MDLHPYDTVHHDTHVNTSFVVHQINCMLVANDNMYIFNQRMKMYFVDFYFSSKDHVVCDYSLIYVIIECN
jgi:hypothetical protein